MLISNRDQVYKGLVVYVANVVGSYSWIKRVEITSAVFETAVGYSMTPICTSVETWLDPEGNTNTQKPPRLAPDLSFDKDTNTWYNKVYSFNCSANRINKFFLHDASIDMKRPYNNHRTFTSFHEAKSYVEKWYGVNKNITCISSSTSPDIKEGNWI